MRKSLICWKIQRLKRGFEWKDSTSDMSGNKFEDRTNFGPVDVQQPILVLDGLLMVCDICENTFIPEENLNFEDLMESLKIRLLNPESPTYHPIGKLSRKASAVSVKKTRNYPQKQKLKSRFLQSFTKFWLASLQVANVSDDSFLIYCVSIATQSRLWFEHLDYFISF